jgi:hypothetical protein
MVLPSPSSGVHAGGLDGSHFDGSGGRRTDLRFIWRPFPNFGTSQKSLTAHLGTVTVSGHCQISNIKASNTSFSFASTLSTLTQTTPSPHSLLA